MSTLWLLSGVIPFHVMDYKLLGNSGLRVSELALGTMTLSLNNPWDWGTDKSNSMEILSAYSDAGGNFIDTANNYQNGESEKVIGEFIAGDRDRYVIATKFTLHNNSLKQDPNAGGNQRKNLFRSVNASLERLDTDYIDLLYLHVWDYTTPIHEIMHGLNILVEEMKVNYIAISDTPAWVVAQANEYAKGKGWEQFVAYQFPYTLGRQDPDAEVIPYARYNDLAMTTWGILRSGLYTGKYTRQDNASGRITRELSEDELQVARGIDKIADQLGVTSAQIAYAWAMAQDEQIIPIVGVTKASHLDDAFHALDVELSPDHITQLGDLVDVPTRFPQSFTGAENVQNLIHGDTYSKLQNHRFKGF